MIISSSVISFLQKVQASELLVLPQNFPKWNSPDNWEEALIEFQEGYQALQDDLGLNEDYLVVCSNYFADPYFIDLSKGDHSEVYFAYSGTGEWQKVLVSESIGEFQKFLQEIVAIEKTSPKFLERCLDFWSAEHPLYVEIAQTLDEMQEPNQENSNENSNEVDESDWQMVRLFVKDFGLQKQKVMVKLKGIAKLSLGEVLRNSKVKDYCWWEGYLKWSRKHVRELEALGAVVELR